MARYFGTSRLLRKTREWLKKPRITGLQFAQLSPVLQKAIKFHTLKQGWQFNINQDTLFNPQPKEVK